MVFLEHSPKGMLLNIIDYTVTMGFDNIVKQLNSAAKLIAGSGKTSNIPKMMS